MSTFSDPLQGATEASASFNWREMRVQLLDAYRDSMDETGREQLLDRFCALMLMVEQKAVPPAALPEFRNTWVKDYRSLIVRDAMVGRRICMATLGRLTQREVLAGRMLADDELRLVAVQAMAALHYTRKQLEALEQQEVDSSAPSLLSRVSTWFKR